MSQLPECERSQEPSPCVQSADSYLHDGVYFRLGTGFGHVGYSGDGPDGELSISGFGAAFSAAIGGTVADGLVVAGALGGHVVTEGADEDAGVPERSAAEITLGPGVDWFIDPRGGWHVGAMAGIALLTVSEPGVEWTGQAWGGSVTGGYDWWIGPQWSLGLLANVSAITAADMTDEDGDDTGYSLSGFTFTVGYALTVH